MRKGILCRVVMLVLSLPSICIAATVGNIADTQGELGIFSIGQKITPSGRRSGEIQGELGIFSMGVEYDRVFDRDLEFKSGNASVTVLGITASESPSPGDSIKDMELESNRIFLKGTFRVHPNVDLFAKLGMADGKWEYKYVSPGLPDVKDEFDGDMGFAWGIGVKAKLFQSPCGLKVMVDGQYLNYKVDGDYKEDDKDLAQHLRQGFIEEGFTTATASYDSETKIQEWQVALYVNKTFGQFSPYGGIKYSDVEVKNEVNVSGSLLDGVPYSGKLDQKAKADKNFGIFLGTDIYIIPNKLSVNIEGRFLDETAGTFGLNYKF